MKIYLNGKEANEGNGYLSMSIQLVVKLKPGEIVKAMFRFYVYNQKRDNYFTKQDLTGKHFSCVKTEWGISNVLPLDVFMDASAGYLLDDCCIFGVEVFALKNECKVGTLFVVGENCSRQYTSKVLNFTGLGEAEHFSPVFKIDGLSWYVETL